MLSPVYPLDESLFFVVFIFCYEGLSVQGRSPNQTEHNYCALRNELLLQSQLLFFSMIESIKHKGIKRLWENNDASKVNPEHTARLKSRLSLLATAKRIDDMDRPGLRLHQLQGYKHRWAINVSGNWRLTFDFIDGNVYLIDYEDYH